MNITDEQAKIIGQEIGKAIVSDPYFGQRIGIAVVKQFMEEVTKSDPNRMTSMPMTYLLETLGTVVGKAVVMRLE